MRRNRRNRRQHQAEEPIIIASDDETDEEPGSHPWPAHIVAAAAAGAAAIARAARAGIAAAAPAIITSPAQQQPQAAAPPVAAPAETATAAVPPAAAVAAPAETVTTAVASAASVAAPAETATAAVALAAADAASTGHADAADAAAEAGAPCSICYEPLYEEGSHRPATLRCGHIFGNECIRTWLQQKNRCPQCNQRAKIRDLTLLYNLPKAAPGCAPDDMQKQLQELEASKRREQQRAAELEESLKELQRQLAMKEHQQLQQAQPQLLPAHQASAAGHSRLPTYSQLQHVAPVMQPQQVSRSGLGIPATGWSVQQQQQQPQLRPPLQQIATSYAGELAARATGNWQQQQLVGRKRTWEQAAGPQQQLQQQQPAAEAPISWPLLVLQPATAAGAETGPPGMQTGAAGLTTAHHTSSQPAGFVSGGFGSAVASWGPRHKRVQGCFTTLQEFELSGSRSFYLDVPGTLALVGETPAPTCSRLRKISLVCPGQASYIQLPSNAGLIRCLASQKQLLVPGSSLDSSTINPNYVAVATNKAGLLIASLGSNNIVQSIPVAGQVWSVSWSPQNSQQLLLGLDKGRIAVADLRKSSTEALLLTSSATGSSRPMAPLHSMIALQPSQLAQLSSSSGMQWDAGAAPEAIVACAGGVYSWTRSSPDYFNPLLPSSCHGGNCESIALAAGGATLAVSFRSPFNWGPPAVGHIGGGGFVSSSYLASNYVPNGAPMHVLGRLGVVRDAGSLSILGGVGGNDNHEEMEVLLPTQPALNATQGAPAASNVQPLATHAASASPAAAAALEGSSPAAVHAAIKGGQEQLMQQTVKLHGHSSSKVLTHGCFIPGLPGVQDEQQVFLSADEASCEPRMWGCSSRALLEQLQPWQALPSHILQLAWGQSDSLDALLVGAMSERRLVLYSWEPQM